MLTQMIPTVTAVISSGQSPEKLFTLLHINQNYTKFKHNPPCEVEKRRRINMLCDNQHWAHKQITRII